MPKLTGERIVLREYRAEDLGEIRKWVNDPATTRYLSTRFWPAQSMDDSRAFLERMMQTGLGAFNFVIASRDNERYIGQIDLFRVNWQLRCAELGMVIGDVSDRGMGYGQEALRLIEGFVFDTLGLERLELEVHMDNEAALSCYQKAGFFLEGVKRHAYFMDGKFCNVGMMSILREEYADRA